MPLARFLGPLGCEELALAGCPAYTVVAAAIFFVSVFVCIVRGVFSVGLGAVGLMSAARDCGGFAGLSLVFRVLPSWDEWFSKRKRRGDL